MVSSWQKEQILILQLRYALIELPSDGISFTARIFIPLGGDIEVASEKTNKRILNLSECWGKNESKHRGVMFMNMHKV